MSPTKTEELLADYQAGEVQAFEELTDEEAYLAAILLDASGLDLAEFCWADNSGPDGIFRAWPFQWPWWRCNDPLQIDQCFAEGTLVLTRRGQVPIEAVVVGEEVLTHAGRWKRVTYSWDRGEQPTVVVKGHGHPGLRTTMDHKFLTADGEWEAPLEGSLWGSPSEFPPSAVPALPGRAYAPGRSSNVPGDVASPDFLWLYGLYVAEGSCSSSFGRDGTVNRTTFSVHTDEVSKVEAALTRVGIRFNTQRVANEACFNIVINSRPLAEWFTAHGGKGAHNKEIAPWVLGLSIDQRRAVLDGAMFGDGYTARNEYTTVSRKLAIGIKLLGQSLGMSATFRSVTGRTSLIGERTINGSDQYVVGLSRTGKAARIGRDSHWWSRVKSRVSVPTARCYDLEVKDDHSFVAEGIVVSNCARSVGKTLSIKVRLFSFPFAHAQQEAVITAPELVHLEPITDLVETVFETCRLGREIRPRGRSATTHRPFMMNFLNGARIIGRIPQKDGKGVKGIHPIWLEMDEAQDYPERGWLELTETLQMGKEGAVWRAHGVTRGVRDKFYEFTQETPDNDWTVHRVTAMHRPIWTDVERESKIKMYGGSRHTPDYRRNILGLHGDATNPLFVLHRLMKCVDKDQSSDYNTEEYYHVEIRAEEVEDRGLDILQFLNFPASHTQRYKTFWAGMDVGYCASDDTEILTQRGWLSSTEVVVGDEALGINPITGASEWQTVSGLYREYFDSIPMTYMKGQSFDAVVTPHHKWLVKSESGHWRWKQTRTLNTKDCVPLTTRRGDLPVEGVYSDDFVELVAWFWTEGWWVSGTSAGIAQSERANPDHVERIRGLLKRLCGDPGPAYRVGSREILHNWREYSKANEGVDFHFRGAAVEALHSVVDHGKVPSVAFLRTLTAEQLKIFIETSIDADGWRTPSGARKIEQRSERGIRSFEIACALAGLATSTSYDASRGRYHLSLLKADTVRPIKAASFPRGSDQAMTVSNLDYSGYIWCPTVTHGNWLARRNGSVYFTGNTHDPSEILIFAEYHPSSEELREQAKRDADPQKDLTIAVPVQGKSRLKLVTRISLYRIEAPEQVRVLLFLMGHYGPKALAMDKTGAGLPLYQDINAGMKEKAEQSAAIREVASRIRGYDFGEKVLVDIDELEADGKESDTEAKFEEMVKEAGIKKNVLEFSTDKMREYVDDGRFLLPWDVNLIKEFQGQTFSYSKAAIDSYGRRRRIFSEGSFHALDAARMAAMGHAQAPIEELVGQDRKSAPVLDRFIM